MGGEPFDVRKVAFGANAKYAVMWGHAHQTKSGLKLDDLMMCRGKVITKKQKGVATVRQMA